jgi:ribonuclease P protein component
MSHTYPRGLRLCTPADFQSVWKKGRRISVPLLTIVRCENMLGHPRLGISIAKKNIRLAVHRNRLKRLARAFFRTHQAALGSRDMILLAHKGADTLTPAEQYQRFRALWRLLIPSPE